VISTAPVRAPGVPPASPIDSSGKKPPVVPISESVATISGVGTVAAATIPRSAPSRERRAKVSPDRNGKKRLQRNRTTIAVSWETICGQLDQMPIQEQFIAVMELHRRLGRRCETIAEKLAEEN
jgi:hypothetical protein